MRTYTVEDSEPVTSAERAKTPSVVPPFSFIGQATMGLSGYWSPPHSLMLWNGYVTSAETLDRAACNSSCACWRIRVATSELTFASRANLSV